MDKEFLNQLINQNDDDLNDMGTDEEEEEEKDLDEKDSDSDDADDNMAVEEE